MDKLYSPATAQKIINKYEFQISKSLGQNFLTDRNIVNSIIRGSGIEEEDLVIEVGPGMGVLTQAAAEHAKFVIGIEIDNKLIPVLDETLNGYNNIRIINEDFLKIDLASVIRDAYEGNKEGFKGVKLIGNLPYYITSPIIMKVLEDRSKEVRKIQSMTIMMQKEVADRIRAVPGTKEYGTISIAVQYYCNVDPIINVSKEVFLPKPKVDSTVLRLTLRDNAPVELINPDIFFAAIKAGFGQRRKTLLNSLTGLYGMDRQQIIKTLDTSGIDPARRAETLNLSEFAALSNAIASRG